MAPFFRIIWLIILFGAGILLLLASSSSHASTWNCNYGGSNPTGSTPVAACQNSLASLTPPRTDTVTCGPITANGATQYISYCSSSYGSLYAYSNDYTVSTCPTGALFGGSPTNLGNTGGSTTVCAAKCTIQCTGNCVGGHGSDPTQSFTYGSWTSTGVACTSSGPSVGPNGCPPGQVSGTFNGATLCLPGGTATTTQTQGTSTQTTAPGDGSTTTTNVTNNTTCSGAGSCTTTTTTTTTTTPAGGGTPTTTTKSDTKQMDQPTFCSQNPNDPACKPLESAFSASCSALPACSGDAVQCAQAQAAWETNCALHPDTSTLSDLGNSVVSGSDPLASTFPNAAANVQHVNLSTSLDQTELFAASCPPDISFSISGHPVFISLSTACTWLGWIGNLMVMGALAAGMVIVGKV